MTLMNGLLVASGIGLALTANAWRPRHWPSSLALVSFFLGWLTTELALQHAAWLAVVALLVVRAGGAAAWTGRAAIGAATLSCVGLVLLHRRGAHARGAVDTALREVLGDDHDARVAAPLRRWLRPSLGWRAIAMPFPVRHPRVETLRDLPFARVGRTTLRLDVYRHRARPTRCPTLVYVHGGGWVIGHRRYQGLPLMQHLAARGWTCISVDYRLSPRATFPDHLEDVKRALAWVREHADEHGVDPSFLVLCGNSAGAHLASLAALTANDPRYQPGFEQADTSVSACIGLYGIYDFTDRHGHFRNAGLRRLLERAVMKTSLEASPAAYAEASPMDRVHPDAPPFYLVHGDRDTLAPTDESRRFCAALRAVSRAPAVLTVIPDAQHAFEVFPSPRTAHVLDGATRFLAHVYGRHLEALGARAAVVESVPPASAAAAAEGAIEATTA